MKRDLVDIKQIVRGGDHAVRSTKPSQRTGRSRVKSGCRTCKTRQVKCDEKKPACQRCLSTGRVCDGYGIWGGGGNSYGNRSSQTKMNLLCTSMLSSWTKGNQFPALAGVGSEESTCFDYFRERTVVKMPGAFDSTFWENIVLQVSSSEPAVFHAVVALAATQRRLELHDSCRDSNVGAITNQWDRVALQQYKAIENLQTHLRLEITTPCRFL